MKKCTLGRTDLEITQLGYGAMEFWGDEEPAHAETVLNTVLDCGINFIDTAAIYGICEEIIGNNISHRRDEFFLATKARTIIPEEIELSVNRSLERLQTDYVDIIQLHNPFEGSEYDENSFDEAIAKLIDLKDKGKVRFISVSTTRKFVDDFLKKDAFDSYQMPYSCLQPEHHDAIYQVGQANCGTIIRGGAAKGGPDKLRKIAQERKDAAWASQMDRYADFWDACNLNELLDGDTPAQFIIRFVMTHPYVHTNIVGTANVNHLKENIQAVEKGPLPEELYKEVLSRVQGNAVEA